MRGIAVIPAYKEERHIGDVVAGIFDTGLADDVVVVDDCSPDDTATRAEAAGAHVLRNETNRDYGGAIKRGYTKALELDADVVYRLDGDGQHNPQDLFAFHNAIADPSCHYVLGNRFKDPNYREIMPLDRLIGNRIIAFVTSLRAGRVVADPPCGFRAMNASYLRRTPYEEFSNDFRIGIEEVLAFLHLDASIDQVPIDCIYEDEESTLSYRDGMKFLYPSVAWWNSTKEFHDGRLTTTSSD